VPRQQAGHMNAVDHPSEISLKLLNPRGRPHMTQRAGQVQPVQGPADGLAATAAGEVRLHEVNQTPQRPAWLYRRSSDWRTGRLVLRGADLLAKCGDYAT